jgi:hypothetical protein
MDRLMGVEQFAEEIDAVMQDQAIDRDEAAIVVAMRHGDLVGDVLIVGSLSEEEKRMRRRTLREVMVDLGEVEGDSQEPESLTSTEPVGRRSRRAS